MSAREVLLVFMVLALACCQILTIATGRSALKSQRYSLMAGQMCVDALRGNTKMLKEFSDNFELSDTGAP